MIRVWAPCCSSPRWRPPQQRPADRLSLDRLRDSLAAVASADTAALRTSYRRFARSLVRHARSSHDPAVGSRRHPPRRARRRPRFRRCGRRAPPGERSTSPTGHTPGISAAWPRRTRAEWEQADRLALGNRVGVETLERRGGVLSAGTQADPGYARRGPGAQRPGPRAATTRPCMARPAMSCALPAGCSAHRTCCMALGRVERASGETDSALAAFEAAAHGGRPACARAAGDRAHRAGGRAGAMAREPISRERPTTIPPRSMEYRSDIAPIATDSELAEFDASRGAARADVSRPILVRARS